MTGALTEDLDWIFPEADKNFNVRAMRSQMDLTPNAVKALASIPSLKAIMNCPNCFANGRKANLVTDKDRLGNFRVKCTTCSSGTSAAYWINPLIKKAIELEIPNSEIDRRLLLNSSSTRKFTDLISKSGHDIKKAQIEEKKRVLLREDELIINSTELGKDDETDLVDGYSTSQTVLRMDNDIGDLYDKVQELFNIVKQQDTYIKAVEKKLEETQNVNRRLEMNVENYSQFIQEMREEVDGQLLVMEKKLAQKNEKIKQMEAAILLNENMEKHQKNQKMNENHQKNEKMSKKEAEITLDLIKNKLSYASIVSKNPFAVLEEAQDNEGLQERLEITGTIPETFKPGKLEPKSRRDAESLSKWLGTPLKEISAKGNAALQKIDYEARNTRELKMIAIQGTRPMKLGDVRRAFARAAPNYDMRRIKNFSRGGGFLEILLEEGYLPIFARQLASEAPNTKLLLNYNPFKTQGQLPEEEFLLRVTTRIARIIKSNTGEMVKQFYSQLAEENNALDKVNIALKELENQEIKETPNAMDIIVDQHLAVNGKPTKKEESSDNQLVREEENEESTTPESINYE
jgi:hypothetical protein